MKSFGQTLKSYRKAHKMSQPDLAAELTKRGYPIKVGAVSTWETGVSQPSAGLFLEICRILEITDIYEEFIGNNPNDLFARLNEEGKEKALDYIRLLAKSGEYQKTEPVTVSFTRKLPLFDLPASAGTGSFLDGESYELMDVGSEVPECADFGIRVDGDSMTPRFLDRQIVWVQKAEQIDDGEFGIFFLDGNSYIKKLQDNKDGVCLISVNPAYPPIKIAPHSSFRTFGRVVG